jgi:hypothetical protein
MVQRTPICILSVEDRLVYRDEIYRIGFEAIPNDGQTENHARLSLVFNNLCAPLAAFRFKLGMV